MYKYIVNPKTNRKVRINGRIGKSVLQQYLSQFGGDGDDVMPKILIYGGCFCPPHRGHFENIRNNLDNYHQVYIFIWRDGIDRHGFSTDINLQIWNLYKSLLTRTNQEKLHISVTTRKGPPYKQGLLSIKDTLPDNAEITVLVGSDYEINRVCDIREWMENEICNNTRRRCLINMIAREEGSPSATNFVRDIRARNNIHNYLPLELLGNPNKLRHMNILLGLENEEEEEEEEISGGVARVLDFGPIDATNEFQGSVGEAIRHFRTNPFRHVKIYSTRVKKWYQNSEQSPSEFIALE